ncbi:hypothetical protein [Ensifer sp.]|uniref:hypothetical protein n=1 Tax=Ensifer sp. TaxID=1872086 RepID=UPI000DDBC69B|nr:hypothetical protein [Ensifer sp.]
MNSRLRVLARSSVVHVVFAFVAMGGWALFANRHHPMPRPLVAGLVQGALSAALTLCLKSAIDALSRRFRGLTRLWMPPLLACLASTSILVAIHALTGTPEILKTIAVPLVVSTSYAVAYNYSISRGELEP